jgi:hypothetical protein
VKLILFILFFLHSIKSIACLPNEIHIREQWIDTYKKDDGTTVSAHLRSEHCRQLKALNYTQDSSPKKFKNFNGKFKAWNITEKKQFNTELDKLPMWLSEYKHSSFLRATIHEGNPANPALAYPANKTIIVFDSFFKSSKKKDIIIHELSHIAVWDLDPVLLQKFFIANGWEYKKGESPKPPSKTILPDSTESPSEDFANSVETYYSNPKAFKEFNSKSFEILESIIKIKEKR